MKQTAVDFLSEKYNYVTWLRNRDEISAGKADEFRKIYLDEAKRMEKEQIQNAFIEGEHQQGFQGESELYYYKTYTEL